MPLNLRNSLRYCNPAVSRIILEKSDLAGCFHWNRHQEPTPEAGKEHAITRIVRMRYIGYDTPRNVTAHGQGFLKLIVNDLHQ